VVEATAFVVPTLGSPTLLRTLGSLIANAEEGDRILVYFNSGQVPEDEALSQLLLDRRVTVKVNPSEQREISDSIREALELAEREFKADLYFLLGDDDAIDRWNLDSAVSAREEMALFVAPAFDERLGRTMGGQGSVVRSHTSADSFLTDVFHDLRILDVGRFGFSPRLLRSFLEKSHIADGTFHETYSALLKSALEAQIAESRILVVPLSSCLVKLGTKDRKSWSQSHSIALFGEAAYLYNLDSNGFPSAKRLADKRVRFLGKLPRLVHMRAVQGSEISAQDSVQNANPWLNKRIKRVNRLFESLGTPLRRTGFSGK
jgi:hypothetical protein